MNNVVTPQFMRMRAKFDASLPTDTALSRFYEVPQWRFHFFSAAQRIVTMPEFTKTEFQEKRRYLEANVAPSLARRALILAQPVEVVRAGAFDKLRFGVEDPAALEEFIEVMESLPATAPTQSSQAVEVALERGRYKHDDEQLQQARWALLRAVKGNEQLAIERLQLDFDPMRYSSEHGQFVPIDPSKV